MELASGLAVDVRGDPRHRRARCPRSARAERGDRDLGRSPRSGRPSARLRDRGRRGGRLRRRLERVLARPAAGRPLRGKAVPRIKGARRRAWAEQTLERHGGPVIFGARFVPGGRTATTVSAGPLRMSWRRFAAFAGAAAVGWAPTQPCSAMSEDGRSRTTSSGPCSPGSASPSAPFSSSKLRGAPGRAVGERLEEAAEEQAPERKAA